MAEFRKKSSECYGPEIPFQNKHKNNLARLFLFFVVIFCLGRLFLINIGRTPKGAYSSRGRSRHLLETAFSEPLLRTLLGTLFYCKTHSRPPSQNPSENPFPRTLPRTFSEPFLEGCVAIRPLRRAPKNSLKRDSEGRRKLQRQIPEKSQSSCPAEVWK